jgi:hypothetical protein
MLFAVFTKVFAITEGLLPKDPRIRRLSRVITLERGALGGAIAVLGGGLLLLLAIARWAAEDFGRLDYASTMRLVVPGVTLTALGFQTVLSSFFLSILRMRRR